MWKRVLQKSDEVHHFIADVQTVDLQETDEPAAARNPTTTYQISVAQTIKMRESGTALI